MNNKLTCVKRAAQIEFSAVLRNDTLDGICTKQYGRGKSIIEILAAELQKEFLGVGGFSARNLWRMTVLYEQYYNSTLILPQLVAEIPWTHNFLILEKCKGYERFY